MGNLINLFLKYGGFVVFLALEGLCMYLVVNNNQEQEEIYVSSARVISGNTLQAWDATSNFLSLGSIADSLATENAELYSHMENSKFIQTIMTDTAEVIEQQFTYLEAKVIKNSTNKANNYITLNRGRKHGVENKMGVFGKHGMVGIVRSVSTNFSIVMPIINVQYKASATLKKNNYFGSLVWDAQNAETAKLEAIPKHIELAKGDSIVTSGYSSIFPEGIMIGVVDDYKLESGSNFYTIDVKLGTNFYDLNYVYIIKNLFAKELEELEEEVTDE